MIARKFMNRQVHSARIDERIRTVLARMRAERLRMIPVLDEAGCIKGIFSTFTVLERIMPPYIVEGDLDSVSYAPDMGMLSAHYAELSDKLVGEVMDTEPLIVHPEESLFAVAAELIRFGKHEFALVAGDRCHLEGIISAGDILNVLGDWQGDV
ncbi:MAG: CBS domain-containing protein [Zetaproteobacteria bacterium]|nr:MAG: CBS domain-containing protein [Zetaproteobacteria bacterium]